MGHSISHQKVIAAAIMAPSLSFAAPWGACRSSLISALASSPPASLDEPLALSSLPQSCFPTSGGLALVYILLYTLISNDWMKFDIYIYIFTYIYTYIHTYIYTYIYIYLCVFIHISRLNIHSFVNVPTTFQLSRHLTAAQLLVR